MKETFNYGFPYPECNPPLTKDISDIEQFRDLALAVDAEVERIATLADDTIVNPDAAVMFEQSPAGPFNNGDQLTFSFLNFDNTGGQLVDLVNDRFTIRQTGFYYVTCFINPNIFSATGNCGVVFRTNGVDGPRHDQANSASPISTHLSAQEVMRLNAGDNITFEYRGVSFSPGLVLVGMYRLV